MLRNAEVKEIAETLFRDQAEWLDASMKKILPPVLHDKFVRGDFSHKDMGKWLRRERIRMIFFSNVPIIRIVQTKHGEDKVLAEFRPRIHVGEREVDIWKLINSDNINPADIWVDSDEKAGT